jgi:hypothetical protein
VSHPHAAERNKRHGAYYNTGVSVTVTQGQIIVEAREAETIGPRLLLY